METSVQVLVYTTTDLHGYDIAAFADHLREGWSIGQNGKCIVIVYKPLTIESKEDVTMADATAGCSVGDSRTMQAH